jgi:TPR repeat protein
LSANNGGQRRPGHTLSRLACTRLIPRLILAFALLALTGGAVAAAPAGTDLDAGLAAVDKQDFDTAFKIFEPLAKAGDTEAQYNLAMLYRSGKGVAKDMRKCAQWFRRAAEQGLAAAQYQLGYLYDQGEGVEQDNPAALAWYRKAAEQGHAGAQVNLGVMYANGTGVAQDLKLAYVWFNLAASQGSSIAFKNKQILGEAFSPEELEALRKLSRQYFQKYVMPYQQPMKPYSAPH